MPGVPGTPYTTKDGGQVSAVDSNGGFRTLFPVEEDAFGYGVVQEVLVVDFLVPAGTTVALPDVIKLKGRHPDGALVQLFYDLQVEAKPALTAVAFDSPGFLKVEFFQDGGTFLPPIGAAFGFFPAPTVPFLLFATTQLTLSGLGQVLVLPGVETEISMRATTNATTDGKVGSVNRPGRIWIAGNRRDFEVA